MLKKTTNVPSKVSSVRGKNLVWNGASDSVTTKELLEKRKIAKKETTGMQSTTPSFADVLEGG